ncbi:MAG TPA: glycogen/starch synthase [Candidatus Avibacteroides faecavium]|nr:glycogen/starch synthase [Candidatus Avibacteroides faecavium]
MNDKILPDYIFESSWEVCNKVGGIYTVLSSRAKTLQTIYKNRLIFIGPDLWQDRDNPLFVQDDELFAAWAAHANANDDLKVRVGHWNVPGKPAVVLVDFKRYYEHKNEIYTECWNDFGVDSLHAYGDYDESSMFSYAAGKVVESYYNYYLRDMDEVRAVYQANEWMTGLGLLYVKKHVPEVATIFTTHATTIGRSIAGNNKPLYDYLFAYNGDQMAQELNVESKHSIEKQAAHNADCFTTVSQITAKECAELLDKPVDVVEMNGFEDDFVPASIKYVNTRRNSRRRLLDVASCLLGREFADDTMMMSIGGRYEFKNKGIDVFVDTVAQLNASRRIRREALAFVFVPAWVAEPRADLLARLKSGEKYTEPLEHPYITHWLHNMDSDRLLSMMHYKGMTNAQDDKVKLIFVPCYLTGRDGILDKTYYDLLLAMDLNVYPSYYEPWGYTPLESAAFKVPTVTTDLAGFGLWVKDMKLGSDIRDGVAVVHRSDYNYNDVVCYTARVIRSFAKLDAKEVAKARKAAGEIARKALWKNFISFYYDAYDVALRNAKKRNQNSK